MASFLTAACVSIYFLIGSITFKGFDFPFSKSFLIGDLTFTVSNFDCKVYFGGMEFSYNNSELSFIASPGDKSKPSNFECTLDLGLKSPLIDEKRKVDVSIIIPVGGQLAFDFVYLNDSCMIQESTLRTCTIAPQISKLESQGASAIFNDGLDKAKKFLNDKINEGMNELSKFISKELSHSGSLKPPLPIPQYIPGAVPIDQWSYAIHVKNFINSLPSFLKINKLSADFPTSNAIRFSNTFYKKDISFDNSFLIKLKFHLHIPGDFGVSGIVAFPYLSCSNKQGFICGLKHAYVENIRTFGGGFGIKDKFIDNFLGPGFANMTNKFIHFINKTHAIKDSSTYSIQESDDGTVVLFENHDPSEEKSFLPYSVRSSSFAFLTWIATLLLFYIY